MPPTPPTTNDIINRIEREGSSLSVMEYADWIEEIADEIQTAAAAARESANDKP